MRYQLRAKFAELPTNVTAIFKSEQSIRQSERLGGIYQVMPSTGTFVPTGTPTSTKLPWANTDRQYANAIDWMVEGSTYGIYNALTPISGANAGTTLTVSARSDIDGDGNQSCVVLYQTGFDSTGSPVGALPDGCGTTPTGVALRYGIPDNLTPSTF
jgi:hypothetical protein